MVKHLKLYKLFSCVCSIKMSCHSSNFVTLFIDTRFAPSVPFSVLFKSNLQDITKVSLDRKRYYKLYCKLQ